MRLGIKTIYKKKTKSSICNLLETQVVLQKLTSEPMGRNSF